MHARGRKGENPHKKRQNSFQSKFSVNVWAAVIGSHLIGPYFLPERLTGDVYLEFLENELPELVLPVLEEDVPVVFQNDGCPAHYQRTVREYTWIMHFQTLGLVEAALFLGLHGPQT